MDYIPDLSAFQAVLRSTDSQYSFASLKFKKGNEKKIKNIVEKVFNFLKEKNYVTGNIFVQRKRTQLKKLALYLVLNADLPALEEMSGLGGGVGALVRTLPALPGPLLSALLQELHMRPFLYEMVAFCRPALALQLADACIANLQHDDPASDPQHPVELAGALYQLTCRLHFARAPPGWAPGVALASLRACLVHLVHLDRLYRNQPVKLARILLCTLDLIETCYGYFTSVQKLEPFSLNDIYRATHEPDGLKTEDLDFKICDSPDRAISESLRACNALLLDHCAALMMNVNSDTICTWNDSDLKQTFGETCYRMNAVLRRIPDAADHRLVGMLEQNSIEPCDLDTVIGVIDPDVIALKIRAHDATSAAWLDALLDQKLLCRHPTLMRLLLSEAATLDEGQSAQLFDSITWVFLYGLSEDGALQRRVAIEAFRRCSDSTKDRIVSKQFHNWFHDKLMTVDFEAALSETFDRLAAGVAGPGDALAVFVQNPRRTLKRLVRAAGDSTAQTELMLRIVERLGDCRERRYLVQSKPALVLAVNAALDDAAAAEDDARRKHLARFVEELVQRRLLREELLRESTPEARAAATAIKEDKKKDLPPEDLTTGSCKGQKTASFGQPDKAKLTSESFGQPDTAKLPSGPFGQLAEAKPLSGLFGQTATAKLSSMSFGQPAEAKPSIWSFGQPDETKPSSGLFSQPTEAKSLTKNLSQPAGANSPLLGSRPRQDMCSKRVTSLVYKCSACGLCFDRHEAMYKHFTNCVPLKKITRIHCMCGLEFDRNNYDYHCEVHRKSTQLVKKTVRIDNDLDIDVREMKKDFMEDDETNEAPKSQIGHVNQETVSAVHKFTTKSTDILAAKVSVVYRCTCILCFERPDFLFNHISNRSCVKKITKIKCICGLVFDKHNYDYHCEIHRKYSVLCVKKITIMNDEMIFVAEMMQEFAEDEERKAVKTKKDAQVQTVDLNESLSKSPAQLNGTIENLSGHKIVSAVIDTIDSGINGEDNYTKITIVMALMAKESEKNVECPNEANPGGNKNNEVIEIRDFETNASEIADDIASSITLASEGDHEPNDNQEASGIELYEHTAPTPPTKPESKDISDSDSSDEEANEITEQLKQFYINYNEETSEITGDTSALKPTTPENDDMENPEPDDKSLEQ